MVGGPPESQPCPKNNSNPVVADERQGLQLSDFVVPATSMSEGSTEKLHCIQAKCVEKIFFVNKSFILTDSSFLSDSCR